MTLLNLPCLLYPILGIVMVLTLTASPTFTPFSHAPFTPASMVPFAHPDPGFLDAISRAMRSNYHTISPGGYQKQHIPMCVLTVSSQKHVRHGSILRVARMDRTDLLQPRFFGYYKFIL